MRATQFNSNFKAMLNDIILGLFQHKGVNLPVWIPSKRSDGLTQYYICNGKRFTLIVIFILKRPLNAAKTSIECFMDPD